MGQRKETSFPPVQECLPAALVPAAWQLLKHKKPMTRAVVALLNWN